MLSKSQKDFLKKFLKECDKSVKDDPDCKEFNRKKITVLKMNELLSNDKSLLPSKPYKSTNEDDNDTPGSSSDNETMCDYLKESGLGDLIKYDETSGYFESTIEAQKAIEEYNREVISKIRFPLIAIVISIVSLIISLVAFFCK